MSKSRIYYAIIPTPIKVGDWRYVMEEEKFEYMSLPFEKAIKASCAAVSEENLTPNLQKLNYFVILFPTYETACDYIRDTSKFLSGLEEKSHEEKAYIYQYPIAKMTLTKDANPISWKEKLSKSAVDHFKIANDGQNLYYTTQPQQEIHPCLSIINDPTTYIIHGIWIQGSYIPYPQLPIISFPIKYHGFFTPSKNFTVIQQVKELFKDYIQPKNRFAFFYHLNRHHKKQAQQIIQTFDDHLSIDKAIEYLLGLYKQLIKNHFNIGSGWLTYGYNDLIQGSFMRRIHFAIRQLGVYHREDTPLTTLKKCNKDVEGNKGNSSIDMKHTIAQDKPKL